MDPDPRTELLAAIARLNELRSKYRGLVRAGHVPLDVYLNPDEYLISGYYEVGPDERYRGGPASIPPGTLEPRSSRSLAL